MRLADGQAEMQDEHSSQLNSSLLFSSHLQHEIPRSTPGERAVGRPRFAQEPIGLRNPHAIAWSTAANRASRRSLSISRFVPEFYG